ncbi:hypothetical protein [Bacillus sp. 03113]|uniref:hypothetical protein n=1 Tax=Bacillus sp. 03113 TaxID=2578211 RepID=UPI0011420B86|nr:hypothetical protein [Bacillus sp. 03113]
MSELLLQQILEKLNTMEAQTNKRFDEIDARFEKIDLRFENIDKRFESMDKRFEKIEFRLDGIENKQLLIKTQLSETNQVVRALFNRQEETDAKLDALSMDVQKLHGKAEMHQQTLSNIIENQKSIYEILGDHEVAIRNFRRGPV